MSEKKKAKGYPTVKEMQEMFPDYPCGRSTCKYFDCPEKAEKCCDLCKPFIEWANKRWNEQIIAIKRSIE